MLKNYLKAAWRNLTKNKIFSVINVAGLSIGMAGCLLILQYVSFQLSFDQFNKNAGDLYRVYNDRYQNGKLIQHGTITYSAIGKAMQDDFPEVVDHARVEPFGKSVVTYGNKKIAIQEVKAVDNSFLTMFSFPLIAGDVSSALIQPHALVLSKTSARKIFGIDDRDFQSVIGKLLIVDTDTLPYKVTGICEDVPENSHIKFDMLTSYVTLYSGKDSWKEADYDFTDSDFWHYIQLRHGTDYKRLQAKFEVFSQRHFQGNKISGSVEKFYLQPLSRAHLYSDFEYEIGDTASATVVWGLLIIAVLIIVIAWVNYINLSTAKSTERAKEVGVRKVVGATKQQLIKQFLTESLIINIISLCIALLLVIAVQQAFDQLIGHQLSLSYLFQKGLNGYNISMVLLVLIACGIVVSGFYPAFILSSLKPVLVLKGKFGASVKGIVLRKALVIGQFAITVALIIGSFVVFKQMQYVSNQNLGMNISQVLVINPPSLSTWDSTFIDRENSFSAELIHIPNVIGSSSSWSVPGGEMGRSFKVRLSGQDVHSYYTMRHNAISKGFLDVYGIKLLAGRDYTYTDFNSDFGKLHNIMLNESAARLLGFKAPAEAIGKTIMRGDRKWDVIGIVNDFHQKSLRYPIEPTLLMPAYSTNSAISVKISPQNLSATITAIKNKFDEFFPGNLFDYYFLDDHFYAQYSNDLLFGKVFAIFSGFAIFIACLGLLGLALFATAQRIKEIGIRKVLGASVSSIVLLLSRDFIGLVVIAILIASPVAWFVMHNWLQDFAYRTSISWWVFVTAGILAILIAILTISIQAISAARSNPVKSLRTE